MIKKIYLLRHASYLPLFHDEKEALSLQGVAEAEKVGGFLSTLPDKPALVYASPILRTQQTGQIVADFLNIPLKTSGELAPGGDFLSLIADLEKEANAPLLVSHAPVIKKILKHYAITVEHLGMASLTCLSLDGSKATLVFNLKA